MTGDDDLKSLWEEYGKRLDASLKLNGALLQRSNLGAVQGALRLVVLELGFSIAGSAAALLALGSFVAGTIGDLRFAVPGIVLFAAAWLSLALCVRQIVALRRIDFDEPVVAIQGALERLRIERILVNTWTIFAAPLLWIPLTIVGLRAVGVNAYAFGPVYLLANLAFGVAVLICGVIVAKRVSAGKSRLGDLLAGRALENARDRLDTIVRFAEG